MQTFLPYPDFQQTAAVLDLKRLGKQRVEVIQVVRALTRPGYGWRHHPAVLMWKGYEEALGRYGLTCCAVWSERGFADTCAGTIRADLAEAGVARIRSQAELAAAGALPGWLGDEALHRSHRSALLRKDSEHYGAVFALDSADEPYVWPVRSAAVLEAERRKQQNAAVRRSRRTPGQRKAPSAAPRRSGTWADGPAR
jgi:Pyrimidine dimer DNA glycosylase